MEELFGLRVTLHQLSLLDTPPLEDTGHARGEHHAGPNACLWQLRPAIEPAADQQGHKHGDVRDLVDHRVEVRPKVGPPANPHEVAEGGKTLRAENLPKFQA